MALGRAVTPVRLAHIGPDLWSLFTMHATGGLRFGPRIPNRLLVFRVADSSGNATLAIVNAITPDKESDQPSRPCGS